MCDSLLGNLWKGFLSAERAEKAKEQDSGVYCLSSWAPKNATLPSKPGLLCQGQVPGGERMGLWIEEISGLMPTKKVFNSQNTLKATKVTYFFYQNNTLLSLAQKMMQGPLPPGETTYLSNETLSPKATLRASQPGQARMHVKLYSEGAWSRGPRRKVREKKNCHFGHILLGNNI